MKLVTLLISLVWLPAFAHAQCIPQWAPDFRYSDVPPLSCCAEFDDGTGTALYLGGSAGLWKLVDGSLQALSQSLLPTINAMTVFDRDGAGPELPRLMLGGYDPAHPYQPGIGLLTWDGQQFEPVQSYKGSVTSMTVHDDGFGFKLYVAGGIWSVDGGPAHGIAAWNGAVWNTLGDGYNGDATAMCSHDDGSGHALYVAGGDLDVRYWQGSQWRVLGLGGRVKRMISSTGGAFGGPALVVTGTFGSGQNLARWQNGAWAYMGPASEGCPIGALQTDHGEAFYMSSGNPWISRWDGSGWSFMTFASVSSILGVHTRNGQQFLVVTAGDLNGRPVPGLALWNESGMQAIGRFGLGLSGPVRAIASGDLGAGPRLFAFGPFRAGANQIAVGAAEFDGHIWTQLGPTSNIAGYGISDAVVFDDGAGSALYVGVSQSYSPLLIGGTNVHMVGKWDGHGWTSIGQPLGPGYVHRLRVLDLDGTGPEPPSLIALGSFENSSRTMNYAARFVNGTWLPLGPPLAAPSSAPATDVAVLDPDGPGPAPPQIYMAGARNAFPEGCVRRLDGGTWTVIRPANSEVIALATFNDGTGPALFAAGNLSPSGVLRWRDGEWTSIGPIGVDIGVGADFVEFDDGRGTSLLLSGMLTIEGTRADVAKFHNGTWERFATDNGIAYYDRRRLATFTHTGRSALFHGGGFTSITDTAGLVISAGYLSAYLACPRTCSPDFDGDGTPATDDDIAAFFACLAGNCCAPCGSPDFNNDGDAGTDQDIESFFRLLVGGAC
jgi:hypothetical protein